MANVATVGQEVVRFPSLRSGPFRWYLGTVSLGMFADNIEHVLGYWLLWELTRSPFWLGYAVFAHWVPFTLLSLHAGALADRYDSRRLLQIAQVMYVFGNVVTGIMVLTGTINVWTMAVLLLIHGLAGVIHEPNAQVLIYGLVGPRTLMSALSLNASMRQAAFFVGPAVGGLLLVTVGPGVGFLINALFHIPFLLNLYGLRRIPVEKGGVHTSNWESVKECLTFVVRHRLLLGLIAMAAVPGLVIGQALQAMMPAFASKYDVGASGYSLLLAASGLGAISMGVALGAVRSLRRRGAIMCWTALGWGLLLGAFAVIPSYLLALLALFVVGATQVTFNALAQTLVQERSPDDLRGRIMGVFFTATLGTRVVSSLAIGVLATALNPSAAFLAAAAVAVVAFLAIAATVPELRRLD